MILSKNRIEEEKIFQYHVRQVFFHQVDPRLEIFPIFCEEWLVDPCPPGMVYCKTLNLYRKFQFIENFKTTQCFVTIVRQHFQWLEFHIKIYSMAGKHCAFSAQKAGKRSLLSETWAGISTLTQWTPCS